MMIIGIWAYAPKESALLFGARWAGWTELLIGQENVIWCS